jgi:two-component system NtrC family response regulator
MDKPKILIIEDDEEICRQMQWALTPDYEVLVARERREVLRVFRTEQPAVVTLDLGLPPHPREVTEGFRMLDELLQTLPNAKIIVVTGQDGKEHALRAIGQGAYDFLRKPIQLDELQVIIRRALYVHRLECEHRLMQQRLAAEASFEGMVGSSSQMQEVFATVRKVATAEVPVLIVGESGTGKELVARAIHRQSLRTSGPFVAINCGAIPENLLESELFGHEKGAFTGAHVQRQGRVELAQGGTLFLDEVGELPLLLQVKLLRFLQEHQIDRVGGRETLAVDTRVVAATNADLQQAMADGRFREDLFYRLGVVVITLPPLRERGEDIILLAQALLQRYTNESVRNIIGFTRQAITALQTHGWPGNVRELENRIKRAMIMAPGRRLTHHDLDLASPYTEYERQGLREARKAMEKELIRLALARNKGNITRTASELGVSRPTLHELVAKYAIDR